MNIKYASLLSLFCVVAANAAKLPATDQLDRAKKALLECRKPTLGNIFGCADKEKDFSLSRDEFLESHRKKSDPMIRLIDRKVFKSCSKATGNHYTEKALRLSYLKKEFKSRGHSEIVKVLCKDNGESFLSSNKSLVEFLDDKLNALYYPKEELSETEDRLEDYINFAITHPDFKPHVDAAKEKVMAVVHEQAKSSE